MNRKRLYALRSSGKRFGLVLAASLCVAGCAHHEFYMDVSPDQPNGHGKSTESTAGLTYSLAGSDGMLFAVSLNAGVWRAVGGAAWQQLPNSPRYATSIAVDPTTQGHLAVGERNGDATPFNLNRIGLWESFDNGDTWTLRFSPLSQSGCRALQSQAIPAVIFTRTGALLIGTPCGVGRKGKTDLQFNFKSSPPGIGAVKAFVLSQGPNGQIVWARSDNQLLISDNDGGLWRTVAIPTNVEGWGTGRHSRGSDFTIAAFGETAIIDFRPDPTTLPSLWSDAADNFNTLLYYFRDRNLWHVQSLKGFSNDGSGLGGRKSFFSVTIDPAKPLDVGNSVFIYYNAAQDILYSQGIAPDGTLTWKRLAMAQCDGCDSHENIHSDVWDVHLALDTRVVRLATDGGVFALEPSYGWVQQNQGLHTHHVHALAVVHPENPSSVYPRVAYVTSDNSEWWRTETTPTVVSVSSAGWNTYNRLGDGSWVAANFWNPKAAVLVRQANFAILTDFGSGLPSGTGIGPNSLFTLSCAPNGATPPNACADNPVLGGEGFGPRTFQVVQGLDNNFSLAFQPFAVVMLANQPLTTLQDGVVKPTAILPPAGRRDPSPYCATPPPGGPALLLNPQFLANPDINRSRYQGWTLMSYAPQGAFAVWVSEGFYYYVAANGPTGITVWQLSGYLPNSCWKHLAQLDGLPIGQDAMYGPLYVNPYLSTDIFVLTKQGVLVPDPKRPSSIIDEYTKFVVDSALTRILSASGMYDANGLFSGGDGRDVVNATRGTGKSVLSAMAFGSQGVHQVDLAASPVTGVFAEIDRNGHWLSLSEPLPRPFTMVADVGFNSEGAGVAYIAQEGRGIGRLTPVETAKLACYFNFSPAATPPVAQVISTDGRPVVSAKISLLVVAQDGNETTSAATTDVNGFVTLPSLSSIVVHLAFAGNGLVAPCETALSLP